MSSNERREEDVRMFLMSNAKYFDTSKIPYVREKLQSMSDSQFMLAVSLEYKDPTMMLIISIMFGEFGVDRFLLGEIGMGILKLFTGGLCGILWIIDIFTVMGRTKETNLNKLLMI